MNFFFHGADDLKLPGGPRGGGYGATQCAVGGRLPPFFTSPGINPRFWGLWGRLRRKIIVLCLLNAAFFAGADTFTFKADKMSGSKSMGKEITILAGNAEVRSDNLLLKAQRIEMQGDDNQFIDCTGGVSGVEEEKEILFQTDRLRYDRTLKIVRLEGNSVLEDRKNEIVAKGRFIEYDDQAEVTVFQISVRLFKDDMVCRSEYAIYRRAEKLLDLSGFPVVFKKDDEFRADRIRGDLDTDDVTMEGSVTGTIKN
jgi:lipopolysaccharide export system protein LptA